MSALASLVAGLKRKSRIDLSCHDVGVRDERLGKSLHRQPVFSFGAAHDRVDGTSETFLSRGATPPRGPAVDGLDRRRAAEMPGQDAEIESAARTKG